MSGYFLSTGRRIYYGSICYGAARYGKIGGAWRRGLLCVKAELRRP